MKTRTTLILLILAVGLGVWIKYFESQRPSTVEAQRQAGNVVNFDREKLEGIAIQRTIASTFAGGTENGS
jgi:hypothetical protein